MALDAIRKGFPLRGRRPDQPVEPAQAPSGSPSSAGEQPAPAEPPLDLATLADLDALDLEGLKHALGGLEALLRRAEADVPAADAEAKAAFDRGDLAGVQAAWERKAQHKATHDELEAHQQRVREAILGRLQPDLDRWQAECSAAVARWRQEQASVAERVDQLYAELAARLEELGQLPQRRLQEQRALLDRYDELARQAPPFSPPMPQVDWSVPEVDAKALAGRLVDLARKLVAWVVRR